MSEVVAASVETAPPSPEEVCDIVQRSKAVLEELRFPKHILDGSPAPLHVQEALAQMVQLAELNARLYAAVEMLAQSVKDHALSCKVEGEPLNLILQRHGRSVGNERDHILALPDDDPRKIEFLTTPNYLLRLVQKGRLQAEAAGVWLRDNLDFSLDAAFCPDFARSQETAGVTAKAMDLKLLWKESPLLGERHWGDFDMLSLEEQEREYQRRVEDPRRWTPPGGEPILSGELAARLFIGTLHRKYNMQSVLLSTHGERIIAFRSVIERIPVERLAQMVDEVVPNAGLVHYTRKDPVTGEITPNFSWVRLICPWDLKMEKGGERWDGSWKKIDRPEYSYEDLLARVAKLPQIFEPGDTG